MSGRSGGKPNFIEMRTSHNGAWMVRQRSVRVERQTFAVFYWLVQFFSSEPPPTTPGQPGEEEEEENGQPGASSSGNQPSADSRPTSSGSRPSSSSSNSNSNSGSNFRSPQGVRLVG